ncbi:uncharacterized protein VTP21DRAFT_2968 [Calcarisporiella thermophila]|uniref:uncharacterized protein n=1 Tax=Calcarisporiella thermophila TaxID=911321 RepID=UPI0037443BA3
MPQSDLLCFKPLRRWRSGRRCQVALVGACLRPLFAAGFCPQRMQLALLSLLCIQAVFSGGGGVVVCFALEMAEMGYALSACPRRWCGLMEGGVGRIRRMKLRLLTSRDLIIS